MLYRKGLPLLSVFLLLFLWQIIAGCINSPYLVPTPATVWVQLIQMVQTASFWHHLMATLGRGLIGFGAALGTGLFLGWLAGKKPWFESFIRPGVVLLRSTPSMSFILLALIWFKGNWVSISVIYWVVLPIIIQNVLEGIRSVDPDLTEMFRAFQIKPWRRFTQLEWPTLLPFLAAGVATGLGFTWKVLIAAEVLSYPTWGIGSQLDTARVYLHIDQVFAWTLVVALIGLSFDYGLVYLLRKPFERWRGAANG